MFRRSWSRRELGALRQRERLVEEPDRGRDARQQVPAHPQPVEHLGPVDVGESVALDESARLREEREAALHVAVLGARHRLAVQRTHTQLGRAGPEHGRQRTRVLLDRGVELVLLEQRLGAREDRLRLRAVVGGDAAREEARVDSETQREPLDRLRWSGASCRARSGRCTPSRSGRPRARSASARRRRAAGAGARRGEARPRRPRRAHSCGARSHTPAQHAEHLTELQSPERDSPPKGGMALLAFPCQPAKLEIT